MRKVFSRWYALGVCTMCDQALSQDELMNNRGVCPKCGYRSGHTICKTKTVVLRTVRIYKKWYSLIPEVKYQAATPDGGLWLVRHYLQRYTPELDES